MHTSAVSLTKKIPSLELLGIASSEFYGKKTHKQQHHSDMKAVVVKKLLLLYNEALLLLETLESVLE